MSEEKRRSPWPGYLGAMAICLISAFNICAAITVLKSGGTYEAIPTVAGGLFTAFQALNILQKHT